MRFVIMFNKVLRVCMYEWYSKNLLDEVWTFVISND